MNNILNLCDIKPGETARIKELLATGSIRRRLLDLGLIEQTSITCLGKSPLGDPLSFSIRGAVIAIRKSDCKNILIELMKG